MKKLVFFFLSGAAILFFIKSVLDFRVQAPPPPPSTPPSPLEQVEAILSQNPIAAESLHAIYRQFPDLVVKQLKNRTVNVAGLVDRIIVTGFEKNKAELSLGKLIAPKIWLVDDLDTHKLFGEAKSDEKFQWELSQNRLYLVRYAYVYEGDRRVFKVVSKLHAFTQGNQAAFPCVLKKWNSGSLYLYYEPPPGATFMERFQN